MATLTITGLETTPDGTAGGAAIVNTNWSRLETVFDPATGSGDSAYSAFWRAVVRSATDPTTNGASIEWDTSAGKPAWRAGHETVTYADPTAFDCEGAKIQEMTLTGNLTFSSLANQAAGRKLTIFLNPGGSSRNLSFPAGWVFIGAAAPASVAANKVARLVLECVGAADADVRASYTVEP